MDALAAAVHRVTSDEVLDQRRSWYQSDDCSKMMTSSIHCDSRRLSRIIFGDGVIPIICDWVKEHRHFTTSLRRHLGEIVKVKFIYVSEEGAYINVDDNKWIKEYDLVVIHGDRLVYVAIPSPAFCARMYQEALSVMGMDAEITEYDRDLMQYFGNDNKKLQFPPSSINFGFLHVRSPMVWL